MTCRGGQELFFVYQQHLAGVVADYVVAPACEFELLCVVGKGKSRHGGAHHASEMGVGNDVHPRHRGVGVGNHVVAAAVVETAVLVVEFEVAPHAELFLGFQHGIFHFVLVVLVGLFEAVKLLFDGEAVAGVELQPCHGVQQGAFFGGDVVAVEHIHLAFLAMFGPQMFGVGHADKEMLEPFAVGTRGVVDNHEVELQAVHFVVFESA